MRTKVKIKSPITFNYLNVKLLAQEAGQKETPTQPAALLAHNSAIRSVSRLKPYDELIREYFNPNL